MVLLAPACTALALTVRHASPRQESGEVCLSCVIRGRGRRPWGAPRAYIPYTGVAVRAAAARRSPPVGGGVVSGRGNKAVHIPHSSLNPGPLSRARARDPTAGRPWMAGWQRGRRPRQAPPLRVICAPSDQTLSLRAGGAGGAGGAAARPLLTCWPRRPLRRGGAAPDWSWVEGNTLK